MTTKNKPIDTIRDGSIKAAIWRNAGEKGDFLTVRISRTWRDEQGGYHETDSFAGTELLRVARIAERAYDRLAELRGTPAEQSDDNGGAQ